MVNLNPRQFIAIQEVRAVTGHSDRWCGWVHLPGYDSPTHVLILRNRDDLITIPRRCPHEGAHLENGEIDDQGNLVCAAHGLRVPIGDDENHFHVALVGDDFYIDPERTKQLQTSAQARQVAALEAEIESLRQAKTALEAQILAVSGQMESMIDSLTTKSRESERQAAEQNRLAAFIGRVIETMDSILVVLDNQGRIHQINRATNRALGYSSDELIGRSPDCLVEETALERMRMMPNGSRLPQDLVVFRRILGGQLANELDLKPKDPSHPAKHFLVHGSSLYDVSGKLEGVVIVGSDVTLLRDREQALIASEQRFRDYSAVSSDQFWHTDKDHRFLSGLDSDGNGSLVDLLPAGMHPSALAPKEDLDNGLWDAHLREIAARQPFRDFECRIRDTGGSSLWLSISGLPVYDESGEFQGYRGTLKNISERRAIEEELRRHRDHLSDLVDEQTADLLAAKEVAERANQMKSEFIANVSHELRTPLHAIMSFAKIGTKRLQSVPLEKIRTYFERITESGERLFHLVNDLLDLAKLEAGHSQPQPQPTDIRELLGNLSSQIESLTHSKHLHLETICESTDSMLEIDPQQVSQVILNLMSNAIKFSPDGEVIELHLRDSEDDSGLLISISDKGPGIPDDELASIFDKFVQSSKTKSGAGGTGLGLSICKEMIDRHDGEIWASNNASGGATFSLRLPRCSPASTTAPDRSTK